MTSSIGREDAEGRVVLADDHDVVREALRDLLAESGLDVVGEAGDGGHAVELARDLSPDVVLLDLRMPGMNGLEATLHIRERDPSVQVIVLSADDDPTTVRRTVQAGALEHIAKGTRPDEIRDAVERAVAIAHRERSDRSLER